MSWKYRKQLNDYMTAVSDESEGELWVYGDIVDSAWWDDDVSPITVRDALDEMGSVSTLNIRVNSYGGSVYAGNAIINILDSYRKKTGAKIVAYIEGIAASMGSGVPMVADKIYMAENAMYMLHKPFAVVIGNTSDLEKEIDVLERAEETLLTNYMRHYNGTKDELKELLKNETWMTASEALECGLCDEVIEAVPVAASAHGIVINGERYIENSVVAKFKRNVPMAAIPKPKQTPKDGGGKQVFEYDKELEQYGISEEAFKQLNLSAETVMNVISVIPISDAIRTDEFISQNRANEFLGSELNADQILTFAKSGMELDDQMNVKAKAYDKLITAAIDEAIKNGIRAKGDNFNETKWKKLLNGLDYDEILDQSREWDEEAQKALNVGKRISEPWKGKTESDFGAVNPNDYNF